MIKVKFDLSKSVFICLLLIFLNAMAQMITLLVSLFLHKFGFMISDIGIVITFFGIGSLIGGYIGGIISDRFSSVMIIKISLIGNSILIGVFPIFHKIIFLCFCVFFMGIFNSSFRPASIISLLESNRKLSESQLLSYRRVAVNLGFSLGAAVLGYIYNKNNYAPFIAMSVILFISFILSNSLIAQKTKKEIEEIISGSRIPNNYIFIILNIVMIITLVILNQNQTTYAIYLESFASFSIKDISFLFSISGVIIVLFQIPIGYSLDKLSYSIACFYGTIFLTIGIGMTSIIDNYFLAIISCIFWTFGEMILFPTILPYILKTSQYKRGKTMGIYQASFSIGGLIAPMSGTLIYNYSPNLLWNISLILGIICGIVFLIIYQYNKYKNRI